MYICQGQSWKIPCLIHANPGGRVWLKHSCIGAIIWAIFKFAGNQFLKKWLFFKDVRPINILGRWWMKVMSHVKNDR